MTFVKLSVNNSWKAAVIEGILSSVSILILPREGYVTI